MQRDEGITLIFSGKAVAVIKGDLQGRGMRLNENIWNCDLVLKVWPRTLVMGVFIAASVEPWPSVECAFFDMCGVFERYIISDLIAFIDRTPQFSRGRLYS